MKIDRCRTFSKMAQHVEKRAHVRKQNRIMAEFVIQNRPFTLYRDMIRDISGSGIFIETATTPFSAGQKIFLSFTLPIFGEQSSISGEIVRVTSVGIGVRFDISERYRKMISNII